jgi:hypothetical protein
VKSGLTQNPIRTFFANIADGRRSVPSQALPTLRCQWDEGNVRASFEASVMRRLLAVRVTSASRRLSAAGTSVRRSSVDYEASASSDEQRARYPDVYAR